MSILPTVNGIEAYKLQVRWTLGAPEDITYTVYGPDAASLLAGALPPNKGQLPVSFGGGIDAVLLSNGAQLVYDQPGYVTETGKSIGLALQQSAIIHRFTAQQVRVQDVFNGSANGIATTDEHTIATGVIPDQGGIANTPIGVTGQASDLAFKFIVDGGIQSQVLDVDIYEDNVLHATEIIMERMGSFVDPQQTQIAIDSGNMGPDGVRSVVVGRKGGGGIAFGTDEVPVLRMTTAQAQTTDMCASCTFTGGDTHHGLPATGKITDLVSLVNGLGVVGVYSAIDVGGVFFWRGDAFYPMSQAMGVNALWYDLGYSNDLYAATDAGVYSKRADIHDPSPFKRLGAMSLKCHKVQQDSGQLYCLAEFSGSSSQHVLVFDGVNRGLGYDGWAQVVSTAGITDFAVIGNYVFCLLRNVPGVLLVHSLIDGSEGDLVVPTGAAIIGLDAISTDGDHTTAIMIRTDQGSAELYYVTSGASLVPLRAATDGSLVDDYGAPVMINSIRANTNGSLECSSSRAPSALLAATSLGVFSCADPTGTSGWQRTDGQSSIGDFVCSYAAAGNVSSADGHTIHPVYAVADSAFYLSNNGSVNWLDMLSLPMDGGPYFYDVFWRLGRLPAASDTSVPVPYGGATYTLRRVLNGINQYCYELINPSSQAPAAQHRSAELSEISAPALMSPVTASTLIVQAMARFLWYTGQPQEIVEVESFFSDSGSPLRTLRPCDSASVSGSPMEYLIAPDGVPFALGTYAGSYYVLEHTISYDRDQDPTSCTTMTRLGKLLLADRQDPAKVSADLMYQVSRQQLYRSRARR